MSTFRPVARDALDRFRETTAALELASSDDRWEIAALPWLDERPLRIQLQDQNNDAIDVTLDEDGLWWFERGSRRLSPRSAEALAEDARAIVSEGALELARV